VSREFFCQKFRLKVWSLFLVVAMLGLALGFTFRPVRAAGLELSTPYPGITVVPGEKVSFPWKSGITVPAGRWEWQS
jgi:hypothetical protein